MADEQANEQASEQTPEQTTGPTGEQVAEKTEETPKGYEVTLSGQTSTPSREQVEQALTQAGKLQTHFQKLVTDGVIDQEGNALNQAPPETEPTVELTNEEKLEKQLLELQTQINTHTETFDQQDKKQQTAKFLSDVNTQLTAQADKYDLTKNDKDIQLLVEAQVLSHIMMNPTSDVGELYKRVTTQFGRVMEKGAGSYLQRKNAQMSRGGDGPGGATGVAREKPFTREDLKSGAVREAAIARFKAMGQIG